MGFVVFCLATWLAVLTFYSMTKSISFMENTVLLLMALTISINLSWIIIEEMEWIKLTEDPLLYAGYLLYRSVLLPLILVIWLHYMKLKRTTEVYFLATIGCTGLIIGFNGIAQFFGIYQFTRWNLLYDLLQVVFLQVLMLLVYWLTAKWLYAEKGEGHI